MEKAQAMVMLSEVISKGIVPMFTAEGHKFIAEYIAETKQEPNIRLKELA